MSETPVLGAQGAQEALGALGADVPPSAEGLPARSDLSPRQRAVVDVSAIGDLALRTAASSLLSATVAPAVVANAMRHPGGERSNLAFYAELAAERDAARSFPAPTELPHVVSRPASLLAEWLANGTVDNISFRSSFTAVNPALRKQWRAFASNNVVHAQHWRHDDGPRPTLCVIHGFMGSSYLLNGLFFSLPWYYRSGYDVLLYTLPFHGRRAERFSPFSGYGYFASGLAGFAESIPNCPVVTPAKLFDEWFPANALVGLGLRLANINRGELNAGMSYHGPLNYQPVIPKDRRMIITGLGDRMAPPDQAVKLWEHWDHCALHWFPGSHVAHVSQLDYLRRMTPFLHDVMF
jgi:hypothetical protein